jgi:hypothetical protein
MKITMLVAAHKAYRMPQDPMYLPLHVGKAGKDLELGFQGDNTGDNISEKNPTFCELTGLYWAWKNLDSDYVGLSHYRRYFRGKSGQDKWDCILTTAQAQALLQKSPVVLPKKRRYYIETAYDQYVHAHPAEPLDLALKLAADQGANYAQVVDAMKKRSWTHIYNMFLMRRDIFEGYCSWLFDILFQLEKEIDISGYSQYDKRVFGFVSERLLDVYLEANKISYLEVPVMFMEKQNWLKKGGAFLRRKFFPRKEG